MAPYGSPGARLRALLLCFEPLRANERFCSGLRALYATTLFMFSLRQAPMTNSGMYTDAGTLHQFHTRLITRRGIKEPLREPGSEPFRGWVICISQWRQEIQGSDLHVLCPWMLRLITLICTCRSVGPALARAVELQQWCEEMFHRASLLRLRQPGCARWNVLIHSLDEGRARVG